MAQTTAFSESDPGEWVYQQPRRNDNGGWSVYVNSSANVRKNPKIQFQKGRCPFGIQQREDAAPNSRSNLEISVETAEMNAFLDQIDQQNMQVLVDNSEQLFSRQVPIETMDMFYRPLNKRPKPDSNFDPLLRIKINSTEGKKQTKVSVVVSEDEQGRIKFAPGHLSDVTAGCSVLPIADVNGLWIVSGKAGMTLVATHLLVWPSDVEDDGFVGMQMDVVDANAAREQIMPDETVINGGGGSGGFDGDGQGGSGSGGSAGDDLLSQATAVTCMED
ncbi:MAG: hypothetical protein K0U52_03685 [Gammaproteobacteria bacterium]|nr:hypothetical protein [Gammaproteobacteria bacterium]